MQLSAIKIKLLEAKQLDEVVELDRLSLGGIWTLKQYRQELSLANSRLLAILPSTRITATARDSQQQLSILGLGGWRAIANEAKITILAIHPDYQGMGLGQLLLLTLLKEASQQGLKYARLEVRASNQSAQSLYQKFGFQIVQKLPNYYHQFQEDALMLYYGYLNQPQFKQNLAIWQQQIDRKLLKNGISKGDGLLAPTDHLN